MKTAKKILSVFLAILLVLSTFAVSASAYDRRDLDNLIRTVDETGREAYRAGTISRDVYSEISRMTENASSCDDQEIDYWYEQLSDALLQLTGGGGYPSEWGAISGRIEWEEIYISFENVQNFFETQGCMLTDSDGNEIEGDIRPENDRLLVRRVHDSGTYTLKIDTVMCDTWDGMSRASNVNITFTVDFDSQSVTFGGSNLPTHTHDYTVSYVNNGDGTHSGVCECGRKSPQSENHNYVDCVCSVCGYECQNHEYINGVCKFCGYECPHSTYINSICTVCGEKCKHNYVGDNCIICGVCHHVDANKDNKCDICLNELYIESSVEDASGNVVVEFGVIPADAVAITSDTTAFSGWMVADGEITINNSITMSDDTNLVLKDGSILTIIGEVGGISSMKALTVYAQSTGDNAGTLNISASSSAYTVASKWGNLTVAGGNVNMTTTSPSGVANGIYHGTLTVTGGSVQITSKTTSTYGAYGIDAFNVSGDIMTVTGGSVQMTITSSSNNAYGVSTNYYSNNAMVVTGGSVQMTVTTKTGDAYGVCGNGCGGDVAIVSGGRVSMNVTSSYYSGYGVYGKGASVPTVLNISGGIVDIDSSNSAKGYGVYSPSSICAIALTDGEAYLNGNIAATNVANDKINVPTIEVASEADSYSKWDGVTELNSYQYLKLSGCKFTYTAENNIITAITTDKTHTVYTLTLTENGTISAEEVSAWQEAGLNVPEIVFDAEANTASITVEEKTATVTLAADALQAHSVKVICGADSNGNSYITDVIPGTEITVTAGTYEGKAFEKWIARLNINGSISETVTFTMPNEDITVEAEFVDCYPLSVFDGTTLTSSPQKVNYTASVSAPAAPEGMRFSCWTAEGIILTEPTASTLTFTMPANAVMLTANYVAPYTVTVTDGKITNAGTSGKVFPGDTVSITADADTNDSRFMEWSSESDITFANKNSKTTTFTMPNSDVSVSAQREQSHTVTVNGGSVTSGLNNAGKAFSGDTVTITADADTNDTRFAEWGSESGIIFANKNSKTTTFTMPASDVSVTAQRGQSYTVTVTGGAAVSGVNNAGKAFPGDTVTITADADTNDSRFAEWVSESGITFADKNIKTTSFTMPNTDVSIAAQREQSYTVTITDGTATSGVNNAGKAFPGDTVTITADNISGHTFTGWTGEGISFENAASTTTTFTMPKSNVTVKANHEAIRVTPPTAGTATYTYDGRILTYQFANEGDKNYYSLSGNRQSNAGTYTVKAHLTVDGAVWTDGTTADKEYTFVIARRPVDKPMAYNTQYYYNGTEQSFILCKQVGASYYYYETTIPRDSVTIANNTRTDAGTQTVTVTPTANFCWQDGTTDTVSFNFTINRYPIPTLFDDPRSFTYNGNPQTYTPFVIRGSNLYDFDGLYYDLSNRTKTASGSYTVTATLKDNFCWYDGSTAPRNMTFQIKEDKLDTYIYYVDDLLTGENTARVDTTYTEFDNISELKGFGNHPEFEPDMLKDRYMPCLENVPDGAKVTFYIKEDSNTPKTISEVNKCTRWEDVKMSDLKPDTIYYMFAYVTHPDYVGYQITDVNDYTCFITSDPQFKLVTAERVTEEDINEEYQSNIIDCIFEGGASTILNTFSTRKVKTTTNLNVKTEHFCDIDEAILQATKDIDEGLDYATIGWYQDGKLVFIDMTAADVAKYKNYLRSQGYLSTASIETFSLTEDEPDETTPREIGEEVSGEPTELTDELLNTMFALDDVSSVLLDNQEFKVLKDPELELSEFEDRNTALLEILEANDLIPETEAPDHYFSTVTVSVLLYDPQTGCVDGESYEYELSANELLPAEALKEIDGYTFDGFYYKEIFDFELEDKSAEATGDHGMILTQGLTKWNPETDYVTRDTGLWAIYIKDGAEESIEYNADAKIAFDNGSEITITLPAIPEGMSYGDVTNNNDDIAVSAVNDGKVTITTVNDITGTESLTFTVAVNANMDGVEDPLYYIVVTATPHEHTGMEDFICDDCGYVDLDACKAAAITAVENAVGEDPDYSAAAIAAYAVGRIKNASSIDAVISEKDNALAAIAKLSKDYTFSLSDGEIIISKNGTKTLTPAFPEGVSSNLTWTSTNSNIATVDSNGVVTGKMAGITMIKATAENGYTAYCAVKVVGIETLSTANIDFETGIITGLTANLDSLDEFIEVTDTTCELEYDTLGTDSIVYLTRDGEIVDAYTVVIFGDVNGDGWYDGMDSMIVSCLANGMLTKEDVGEAVYTAADCNHDGVIDQLDVDLLQQAGVLLADVDQSKSEEELLETSSAYVEYLNLIDQTVETETTEVVEDEPVDPGYTFNFFDMILNLIKEIITVIKSAIEFFK